MANKAGRGSDQFMLRLPEGMRDKIKEVSDASGRSMNAEIVARLEASFSMHSDGLSEKIYSRIIEVQEGMKLEFNKMRQQLKEEQLMRAKAEDSLLKERLKE